MREIELGEFEKRLKMGGQYVLKFEKKYYFLLKRGLYYKAGHVHNWSGDSRGIGLNPHIVEKVPLDGLVVENRRTEKCYVIDDVERAESSHGEEVQRGKKLIVFPLFSFEEVEIEDGENVPRGLLFD